MNPPDLVAVPPGAVRVTSTGPAACAGVVTATFASDTTVRPVAATPPRVTWVVPDRPVPVIVTVAPPPGAPVAGSMLVMVGAAGVGEGS